MEGVTDLQILDAQDNLDAVFDKLDHPLLDGKGWMCPKLSILSFTASRSSHCSQLLRMVRARNVRTDGDSIVHPRSYIDAITIYNLKEIGERLSAEIEATGASLTLGGSPWRDQWALKMWDLDWET